MIRQALILAAGLLTVSFSSMLRCQVQAADAASKVASQSETAASTDAKEQTDASTDKKDDAGKKDVAPAAAKPELSPAMTALRDGVRRTLAAHAKQPFTTQQNTATEIMNQCLAFGCATEVTVEGGKRLNGITCLCWNYPCAGFEMVVPSRKHLAARLGYGAQERPGQFIAMLAMARVPATYPARTGHQTRTVADLVESEKLACRSGTDMSLKLLGLSYYVDEPQWKNDLDETWSIDRMLKEEMAQPVVTAPEGGLDRLLGLSFAVERRTKQGKPLQGELLRAKNFVAEFQGFAMQLQNAEGTWGPAFFTARSTSNDAAVQLQATGRVLEWLAMSLPEKQLADDQVVKAVERVTSLLSSQRYQWNVPALSTREITSVAHAVHALAVYDERVFKPADVEPKPDAEKQTPATAGRNPAKPATR